MQLKDEMIDQLAIGRRIVENGHQDEMERPPACIGGADGLMRGRRKRRLVPRPFA